MMTAVALSQPPLPWPWNAMSRSLNLLGALSPMAAGALAFRLFCTPRRAPLSEREQRFLEKATPFALPFRGKVLAGYTWGEGERTVLLVHGWESRAARMRGFVQPLVARGLRVVAFDGPAHGSSPGSRLSLVHYSEAIRAAIEAQRVGHAIIAHSFGAAATAFLLANSPEIEVERLVLSGPPSELSGMTGNFASKLRLSGSVLAGLHRYIEWRFGRSMEDFSIAGMAHQVRARGLVIHDRADSVVPFRDGQAIASAWPAADLLATDGLDHRGALRSPEIVRAVVSFLLDS